MRSGSRILRAEDGEKLHRVRLFHASCGCGVLVAGDLYMVRMIPLKRSPDKAFGREKPAPEPLLVLGECSTARAGGPSFNGHASNEMFGYSYFTAAHHGLIRKIPLFQS